MVTKTKGVIPSSRIDPIRGKVKQRKEQDIRDDALSCDNFISQIREKCLDNKYVEAYINKVLQNKQSEEFEKPEPYIKGQKKADGFLKKAVNLFKRKDNKEDSYEQYLNKTLDNTSLKTVRSKDLKNLLGTSVAKNEIESLAEDLNQDLEILLHHPIFQRIKGKDLKTMSKNCINLANDPLNNKEISNTGASNISVKDDRVKNVRNIKVKRAEVANDYR